jgi:hypothetical protein
MTPLRCHLADLFAAGEIDSLRIVGLGWSVRADLELGGMAGSVFSSADDYTPGDPRLAALTDPVLAKIRRALDDSEDWRPCPTADEVRAHSLAHPCVGPSWMPSGNRVALHWGRWHVRGAHGNEIALVGLAGSRLVLANGTSFAQDLPARLGRRQWLPLEADGDAVPWPEVPRG